MTSLNYCPEDAPDVTRPVPSLCESFRGVIIKLDRGKNVSEPLAVGHPLRDHVDFAVAIIDLRIAG